MEPLTNACLVRALRNHEIVQTFAFGTLGLSLNKILAAVRDVDPVVLQSCFSQQGLEFLSKSLACSQSWLETFAFLKLKAPIASIDDPWQFPTSTLVYDRSCMALPEPQYGYHQ